MRVISTQDCENVNGGDRWGGNGSGAPAETPDTTVSDVVTVAGTLLMAIFILSR
jgi:hypothetical protein